MEDMSYYIIREILRSELYERCEKKRCIFGGGNLCVDMRGCKQLEISGEARITGGTAASHGGNICLYINGAGTKKSGEMIITGGTVYGGINDDKGHVTVK